MHFGQYEICNAMISSKLIWQVLKLNDLTGQADSHRHTRTGRHKGQKVGSGEGVKVGKGKDRAMGGRRETWNRGFHQV